MFLVIEIIGIVCSLIAAIVTVILTARKLYLKIKETKN